MKNPMTFFTLACTVRGSFAKFRMAERAKRFIDEYLSVFKAKNEKKMRKHNQPYEIEIREVDIKEKKRVKIHYHFPKIQMNGVTMAMICFHL